MPDKLKNYAIGQWVEGTGNGKVLLDASTGEPIAIASSQGLDIAEMMTYARSKGCENLSKMTFQERGRMLKKLALYLHSIRKEFYPLSYRTGATKADSWIDIDGGIGTLFAYASLRKQFPDTPFYVDGDPANLSKNGTFIGHHIMVPRKGVAIHINAFNFPVWGMLEKISVNLMAGVPAIVKPATLTSYLTQAVVKKIVASDILPPGALQLVCGSARDILDYVESQDIVTFTGSASTGRLLKAHDRIQSEAVPFNMEADSLNCIVLGKDVSPESEEFELFIKEIRRELTAKCGQKCTAIRRIIVPEDRIEAVQIALGKALAKVKIGDPRNENVRMGALAGKGQVEEVQARIQDLASTSEIILGNKGKLELLDASEEKGAFMSPTLLLQNEPFKNTNVHEIEAFGPVATMMPYGDLDEAITLANMGKGSLCCTIATYDDNIARSYVLGAASHHGRILVLNRESAKESTGHGSPMPLLVHGGPGRAGGGEEMGGKRGILHYLQRCAIQGTPETITKITQVFQEGGKQPESEIHLFRKHFEDLKIGDTITTAKHTVTESDIVNFANVSGDHFYAHVDETSLDETIFEGRVAHGYYILSKAAGLFVEAKKGPVLLNYGIDTCRFTKPVYPGTTIGVRLTVKEKIAQEKREPEDIAKGIVKYLVEVYDQTEETVAIATILTMVKMKNQD